MIKILTLWKLTYILLMRLSSSLPSATSAYFCPFTGVFKACIVWNRLALSKKWNFKLFFSKRKVIQKFWLFWSDMPVKKCFLIAFLNNFKGTALGNCFRNINIYWLCFCLIKENYFGIYNFSGVGFY